MTPAFAVGGTSKHCRYSVVRSASPELPATRVAGKIVSFQPVVHYNKIYLVQV